MKPLTIWRPSLRRAWRKLFIAFLLASALVLGCLYLFSFLRAASLIYSFSLSRPPLAVRAYMKFFRHSTGQVDFSIPGKNGPVPVRMVFPLGSTQAPIVVLVHGLAPQGNKDWLLNVVALRMAQIGLRVIMPNLSSEQHRLMRSSDLDDIGAAVQWSASTSGKRVALFGISFGGGLAMAAAEMPQYSNLIKMVFSDAGYNSIDRLGHYYIGQKVMAPNGSPYPESPPGSGPLLMAFQHLDEMVPKQDLIAIRNVILGEALNESGGPAPLHVLTPTQNKIYNELRTAKTPEMREKYLRLLGHHQAEMAAISPDRHLNGLHAPLYILHGVEDNSIPPEETLWTLSEAPLRAKIHILITPWMMHAILVGRVSLWEKLKVGNFVREALNAAFRSVPL